MKKFLKCLAIAFVIPLCFLLVGCGKQDLSGYKIKDIKRTDFNEETITYTITYEDDSTFSYTVPNENVVSISKIEKTKSENNVDTYTITLSNNKTSTFEVTNGNAIKSITYDYSDGLKDYYKINYTDGTSTSYSITNGKDGSDGVTLEDMYEASGGDDKYENITQFIEEYLTINVNSATNNTIATGKAVLSAVSVYSFTNVTNPYYSYYYGVKNGKYVAPSAGAGVIYSLDKEKGDAYIITNAHVVYNEEADDGNNYANKVMCYLYGQESSIQFQYEKNEDGTIKYQDAYGTYPVYVYDEQGYPKIDYGEYAIECEIIGASIDYDIAVLKVTNSEVLKKSSALSAEVADSDEVFLNSTAIAIGNPDAGGISVTTGVISVISEYINVEIETDNPSTLREFRIDTPVNSGNSGGGLFNSEGKLIGIVNAKTSDNTIENMGYAIPSNIATNLAENMIYNYEKDGLKSAKKIFIGITSTIKSSSAVYYTETLTTKIVEEVMVSKVEEESLAETMGFKVNDIVKSVTIFDGVNSTVYEITRFYQISDLMLKVKVGDVVSFNCMSQEDGGAVVRSCTVKAEDFKEVY